MTTTELPDISTDVRDLIVRAERFTSKYPMSEKQSAYALKLVRACGVDDNDLSTINSSGASFLIDNLRDMAQPYINAQRTDADSLTAMPVDVGNKARFTGKVISIRETYSGFGTSNLLVVANDQYRIKTFTTQEWVHDIEVGDTITLVGTVKGIDEFRGASSTVLTRCRLVS